MQTMETAPFWDKIAPKYAKKPVANPEAYAAKLTRIRALLRPEDRVLELGCGTGSTALALAGDVAQMTGTDISQGMIAIAERKGRVAEASNLTFRQAEATTLQAEAPFDVVAAYSLLHLVEDLPGVLAAVYAQVKPGGLFLSKTVCLGDSNGLIRLFVRALRLVGIAPPVSFLSKAALEREIRRAGFEIVESRYFETSRLNPFITARRPD